MVIGGVQIGLWGYIGEKGFIDLIRIRVWGTFSGSIRGRGGALLGGGRMGPFLGGGGCSSSLGHESIECGGGARRHCGDADERRETERSERREKEKARGGRPENDGAEARTKREHPVVAEESLRKDSDERLQSHYARESGWSLCFGTND